MPGNKISRRDFMKIIPIAPFAVSDRIKWDVEQIMNPPEPYWKQTLAKGVSFIPEKIKQDLSELEDKALLQDALYLIKDSIQYNRALVQGDLKRTNSNMNNTVDLSKKSQYFQQNIDFEYKFSKSFPKVSYQEDPTRARIFQDLAGFVLDDIMKTLDQPGFHALNDFEVEFLKGAEDYLETAIKINEKAYDLSPDNFKEQLQNSIGSGYNNLGLTLNFLGRLGEAKEMYEKALDMKPEDENIRQNIKNLRANGIYRTR